MNYSIITPTRNEGKYIRETLKSVISQTILPVEWMIMDDDSTDDTSLIVKEYLTDYPFIKYMKLTDFRNELRNRGGRVAAVINYADSLRSAKVDLIVKLDGDTSFDKDFFANIISEFEKDPLLAVASGHLVQDGVAEYISDRNSGRGATLIIRYDCYLQIGKFVESKTRGEDVMAFVAARSFGWRTQTFDYYFNHLKPVGFLNSALKNHYETGFYKGTIPYWFPYFIGTLLRDIFLKPYFIGALANLYGYCLSCIILRYRPFPYFASKQLRREQKIKFKKMLGINVKK